MTKLWNYTTNLAITVGVGLGVVAVLNVVIGGFFR
jgi:hypothetical protein